MSAAAMLEHLGQLPLDGLPNPPAHAGRRGGTIRSRRRSAAPVPSASTEAALVLWSGTETTAAAAAERRCADRAWPAYRALHLVRSGTVVLTASPFKRDADLTDSWCDIRQPCRKGEKTPWFGRAEEKALRELAAAGLVSLGRLRSFRHWGVFFKARQFELTPAGLALWHRWAYLVDPELGRQDRLAEDLEMWKWRNR